jgi:hypothetical protein
MSPLSREDLIELGVSFPTRSLTAWTWEQLAATKGRETRLQTRGMSAAHLSGIRDLVAIVEKRQQELGESHELPPQVVALAQRLREEALGYWREAKQMARVEFGAQPDLLARFRPGVRTGLLIATLIRELETAVPLLREHSAQLEALGANAAFIERGELLIGRLKEVKLQLDAACRALPTPVDQQCHDKGLLYDLTRKLVRVGRLEFMLDPEQAAHFNFTGVRHERGVSTKPRLKNSSAAGR